MGHEGYSKFPVYIHFVVGKVIVFGMKAHSESKLLANHIIERNNKEEAS